MALKYLRRRCFSGLAVVCLSFTQWRQIICEAKWQQALLPGAGRRSAHGTEHSAWHRLWGADGAPPPGLLPRAFCSLPLEKKKQHQLPQRCPSCLGLFILALLQMGFMGSSWDSIPCLIGGQLQRLGAFIECFTGNQEEKREGETFQASTDKGQTWSGLFLQALLEMQPLIPMPHWSVGDPGAC